jgi:3-oxoacyl-[acyl-carrier-protein] synthase-3
MDNSDEWIVERTGIHERRFGDRKTETTSILGTKAARKAIKNAGLEPKDIDFIIFATLSPDYYFPGCGVLTQRQLGIQSTGIGALDVRNQCSGFVYGLSVADQFIKAGTYKNILLIGSEMHSMGLDMTTRGRGVSVIFGDGAGAIVISAGADEGRGVLSSKLHSDGDFAEELCMISPGAHGGVHDHKTDFGMPDDPMKPTFLTQKMLDEALIFPYMNGQLVFKNAVHRFPEVIAEVCAENGVAPGEINMLIPHQANLRISKFVQKRLGLSDEQVHNNIQKYGNTTAASIPIALAEAVEMGKINKGDLVCLAAFGSGFTWAASLIRW